MTKAIDTSGSSTNPDGTPLETLERWLRAETDFEHFSREFYREHGRPFETEELPEEFSRIHAQFPTNIYNAFVEPEESGRTFSTKIGKSHLEHQFFLPGRDIFINKFPRYCNPDIHTNRFFEICYVYTGSYECVFHTGKEVLRIPLRQGDFLFIPPGRDFQSIVFSDSIILNIGIRQTTFQETFAQSLPENSYLGRFFAGALSGEGSGTNGLIFPTGEDAQLRRYVQELCLSYCTDSLYSKRIMNAQLSILFLLLLQSHSAHVTVSRAASGSYFPEQIAAVIHHIEENYTRTSLKETAEIFGYSPDYLNRIFKQETSLSVGDMILELKMEKAQELLATTDLSIAGIGEFLNYQNAASFPRAFKKFCGMTPAEYRREKGKATP